MTNPESSPIDPEPDGATIEAVLSLGQALVSELEVTDTAGRWMAHYLAERLTELDATPVDERAVAASEVSDLVMRLWALRRELPGGPLLPATDAVERAIERLDPDRPTWSYFGLLPTEAEPSDKELEVLAPLRLAMSIDRVAGNLVQALLGYASVVATQQDSAWVQHARAVGEQATRSAFRVRYSAAADESDRPAPDTWIAVLTERTESMLQTLESLRGALEADGDATIARGAE